MLLSMAWRNLWRRRRRTLITLSSIAFGTMLSWLFTGVGDANWRAMIDLAARLGGGHVALQHPAYLDSPALSRSLPMADALRARALDDPEVLRAAPRISGQMMLASAARNYGAAFIAFDPALEDSTTLSLLDAMHAEPGADPRTVLFDARGRGGIALGARLAERLNVGIGGKVVWTLTDKQGEIVQEALRVRALLRSGSPGVDGAMALLPIAPLRESLGYAPGEAVQVALFLRDQRAAQRVADRLQLRLGGSGVAALPWHDLQPELAGYIAMEVASSDFLEAVVMLLVAAGIFNTLFVSVMERRREFGVLRAIGFAPAQLTGMVMVESACLGLTGVAAAALLFVAPYYYLREVGVDISGLMGGGAAEVAGVALPTVLRADLYAGSAVLITALALLATLLVGLYPAWRAGRVDPAETIRLV